MKLCKYCDRNGINILRHKALKLSSIDEFNDPFEFRLAKCGDENVNRAFKVLYDFQKNAYRVVCLSANFNNLIMWSHYSKNHTGLLITFDTSQILVDGQKLSDHVQEVDYVEDMILVPDNFPAIGKAEQVSIIYKSTHKKYKDWKYEQEYRAIVNFDHAEKKRYIDIPPESIVEVVLGLHCDLETELNIKSILQGSEYRHVKLKRAFLDDRKYRMRYDNVVL